MFIRSRELTSASCQSMAHIAIFWYVNLYTRVRAARPSALILVSSKHNRLAFILPWNVHSCQDVQCHLLSLVRAPNRLSHYKVRHALYTPINFDRVINLCGTIAKKNSQTTASLSKNRKSFALCLLHSFPFKYSRTPRMIIVSFKKMHMHSLLKMRHVEQNFPNQSNQSIPYPDYFQWKYLHI